MDKRHLSVGILTANDLLALAILTALTQAGIPASRNPTTPVRVWVVDDVTVRQPRPAGACLLLSACTHPHTLQRHLASGVNGCLSLDDSPVDRLPQAVQDVAQGGMYLSPVMAALLARLEYYTHHVQPRLTPYQREVLRLMNQHLTGRQIAVRLGRTTDAIYQVQRCLRDLFQAPNNSALLECARESGLLD